MNGRSVGQGRLSGLGAHANEPGYMNAYMLERADAPSDRCTAGEMSIPIGALKARAHSYL